MRPWGTLTSVNMTAAAGARLGGVIQGTFGVIQGTLGVIFREHWV
jgi:uncharacterized membrane protein